MPDTYEVIKLGENAWRIEETGVRAFLFAGTDKALLIDSGFGKGDMKKTVEELTSLPVMLVNTHTDGDHTGCNSQFIPAYMHPAEYAHYFDKNHNHTPPNAEVSPLWDGDIIDIGSRKFEVILIPGHTPGSIALLDRVNKLLISGDSISESPIFMFGSHRNLLAYIDSLKKLQKLGGFDTIYPSHGPLPLKPGIIEKLIDGAKQFLKGEIEGKTPPFEIPAKLYSTNSVAFLL